VKEEEIKGKGCVMADGGMDAPGYIVLSNSINVGFEVGDTWCIRQLRKLALENRHHFTLVI